MGGVEVGLGMARMRSGAAAYLGERRLRSSGLCIPSSGKMTDVIYMHLSSPLQGPTLPILAQPIRPPCRPAPPASPTAPFDPAPNAIVPPPPPPPIQPPTALRPTANLSRFLIALSALMNNPSPPRPCSSSPSCALAPLLLSPTCAGAPLLL